MLIGLVILCYTPETTSMNYGDKSNITNQRKYKPPYNLHNMPLLSTKAGAYISSEKVLRFFSVHFLGQFYRVFIVIFRKNINENIIGVIKGTYFFICLDFSKQVLYFLLSLQFFEQLS